MAENLGGKHQTRKDLLIERARRADKAAALAILDRTGKGVAPQQGDKLP
ncbi:MAG: hypothetical protein ACK4ZN_04345 [Oceanibaculum sp.]|jgi:hypothetical protein